MDMTDTDRPVIFYLVLGAAAMNKAVGATRDVLKVKAASLADPGPDVRDAAFLAATDLTGRRPGQQCYELLDPEVPGDTVGNTPAALFQP
ncbi:uncharacterized protein ASPGLDRAFT_56388 [Aspergillus glaucus CBS 516.65]|uniref:Uncharacterized protein n=1 Tax=Aspergillus glaucus CBS 516.65 TaxID=1160497 RepID=A0A1L9VSG4_ASPGL|nr:hypothetical protein ASPGLDRAFT_56388 [Aspergillus glaucus CBS 516.65]OJJ86845.1 hypothetical protein ASPGLDRAFT_56388 [Aspergillus glaucus CBS 516.65]